MGMDVYGNNPTMLVSEKKFPIYLKYDDMNWPDREKHPDWEKEKDEFWNQLNDYEKSNPGIYFRNNCWWWRPLWQYSKFVNDHYKLGLIDEDLFESGSYNDGAGLDAEGSVKLAMHLQMSIEDKTGMKYANERQEWLDSLEDEPCSRCNNNNRGKVKKKDCNPCGGKGTKKPFEASYPFDLRNVSDFAKFLEFSGGFKIC